jgi:periplasmic protein CpxP/Spy
MRKLIAVAALAMVLPATAEAQDAPQQKQGRGMMQSTIEWLVTECAKFNATPEQVTRLEALAKKFESETAKQREEMQKVREEIQGGGDREALMQKIRPIRDEMTKKEEAVVEEALKVLNDEQKATVKQMIEARREEMRNRRRGAGPRVR